MAHIEAAFLRSSPTDRLGPYRVRDYEALPDDERCELLFGRLYVSPSPSVAHQVLAALLLEHFMAIARRSRGLALGAPCDVVLGDHTVVQPDVLYMTAATRVRILRDRIEGAPDLIVEIVSPSTVRRDRIEKLARYAEAGVPELWFVDAESRTFEFLVNERGRLGFVLATGGRYRSPLIDEVSVDPGAILADAERMLRPADPPGGPGAPGGPAL